MIMAISLGSYYLGTKAKVSDQDLPFGIEILKNPLINQWKASVKGKLAAKDENSITLQDNQGNSIIIPLRASNDPKMWTKFFIVDNEGKATPPEAVDLELIPLGVVLRGEFFVLPEPNNKNRIVGSQFVYDQRDQELK